MVKRYQNPLGGMQRHDNNGAAQVTGLVTAYRDDFSGAALNPDEWDVALGEGHLITVGGGELNIRSGITPNTETIITGKVPFTVPFRAWFIGRVSQRIANQEIYFEAVDASGDMVALYLLDGTVVTTGKFDCLNMGNSAGATINPSFLTSAVDSIYELQLFPDECWFGQRAADSNSTRGLNGCRTRNIPAPNDEYFLRIRVKNLAAAPASSTIVTLGAVVAQDINELSVEVSGGQGSVAGAQAVPVYLTGPAPIAVANNAQFYNDSIILLAANGVFVGTARDFGGSGQSGRKQMSATVFADQDGTLFIYMSNDSVTWRQAGKSNCLAGDSTILSVPLCTRYYRVGYVNGAVAQAAFMLNSQQTGA